MLDRKYRDIVARVEKDLDLEEEAIVNQSELLGYINEGVREAVKEVIGICGADYFLDKASLALVQGQQEYDLPARIFANKIRRIIYNNGQEKYKIRRIKNLEEVAEIDPNEKYRILMLNAYGTGPKVELYPASRETSASNVTIFFTREAREFTGTNFDETLDVPEAFDFIVAYTKKLCVRKELGGVDSDSVKAEEAAARQKFIDSLTERFPDEDDEIQLDLSFYRDFDSSGYF